MEFVLILFSIVAGYVMIVLIAEALVWRIQPAMDGGVTLTVKDGERAITRTVYGHEFDGALYVSSNHWFRSWYWAALRNPELEVARDGETTTCIAQRVTGAEHDRVLAGYNMGFVLRLLCGFAPSRFLRLDPVGL